jgi:hypothetical protein
VQMPVRLGLSASRRNSLSLTHGRGNALRVRNKVRDREGALVSTRDACATQDVGFNEQ